MIPIEASSKENESEVYRNINKPLLIDSVIKFKVGDSVRISRSKGIFEKGYLPNWSEKIYTVDQIKNTIPVTYFLRDTSGEVIEGSFYNQELQKTKQKVFKIEMVMRKKKIDGIEHGLVKWLGWDTKFNTWESMKEIKKLN